MQDDQIMTYKEALDQGIIKENDYFLIKYPNGKSILFRLVKAEDGYVMWGPLTERTIFLEENRGNTNFFDWEDSIVRDEYFLSDKFEEIHACKLFRDNERHTHKEILSRLNNIGEVYLHPDDANMRYCIGICKREDASYILVVDRCSLRMEALDRGIFKWIPVFAARPEATPKNTMKLLIEKDRGSYNAPWICFNDGEEYESKSLDMKVQEKVQETVTYCEAIDQGKFRENDYFSFKYPDGKSKLFRLIMTEKGYALLGEPTKTPIHLKGKAGYEQFLDLANNQVNREYFLPNVFEDVYVYGPPKEKYEIIPEDGFIDGPEDIKKMDKHPNDKDMEYALASLCTIMIEPTLFGVFTMNKGEECFNTLYDSNGKIYELHYAVRPVAIPKPTLKFLVKGEGSRKNPWTYINNG